MAIFKRYHFHTDVMGTHVTLDTDYKAHYTEIVYLLAKPHLAVPVRYQVILAFKWVPHNDLNFHLPQKLVHSSP